MRKIEKLPPPEILVEEGASWTVELLGHNSGSKEYKDVERRYGNSQIRDRLREETAKKCAYCESLVESVSYIHIEHIRPKRQNPELTFEWENLTLACQICNTNKGADEPTSENFVHPYNDSPEERLHFIGAMIVNRPNDVGARNMISWLELNRPELIVSRNEIVERVHSIYLEAINLPHDARRRFLGYAMKPLLRARSRHSRVAKCVEDILETEYKALLEN